MTLTAAKTDVGRRKRNRYVLDVDDIPQLSPAEREEIRDVCSRFAFLSNEYYLSLIDWTDPDDPIRRLVIPCRQELTEWGSLDVSDEESITVRRGVQHKYATTVLLLVTEMCASFCRYCFRKRLFMAGNRETSCDVAEGIDYISRHPEVNNVLITGGDPMVLPTSRLRRILESLRAISSVRIIRIGTKMPAFDPFRFTDDPELLELIATHSRPDRRIYFVCHFDHPMELSKESRESIRVIQRAGAICVNQNPISRGISDDPAVMSELWNELSYIGVPQYYVFQNRPTIGNRPYRVPIVDAYFRIEEAKRKCSGLAKRAKYVMSHHSGKVEIVGVDDSFIYLKYHRAKHKEDEQRLMLCHRDDSAYWLDDLKPVEKRRPNA
jgi:KamA family protein